MKSFSRSTAQAVSGLLAVSVVAALLSATPAGAADRPRVECSVNVADQSVSFTVDAYDLSVGTKIPLNMSRVDSDGDEVFVFFGAERVQFEAGPAGFSRQRLVVAIPSGVEAADFDFFARYKLSKGQKGPREFCGARAVSEVQPGFPVDVVDNVRVAEDEAGCWAVDYEADGEPGIDTYVSLTGDVGTSQNLRGDGRWLKKLNANFPPRVFIDESVDTAILRGGGSAKRTIDCVRGWTGDVTLLDSADLAPDAVVSVFATAKVSYDGNDYLFWTQKWSDPFCPRCVYEQSYITNLATGEVAEITDQISGDRFHAAGLRSCDGRFVELRSRSTDVEPDNSQIIDLETGQSLDNIDYDFGQFMRGFDCDGYFWYKPLPAEATVRRIRLPS